MADWPLLADGQRATIYGVNDVPEGGSHLNVLGTKITANVTGNLAGTFREITPSTGVDVAGIYIGIETDNFAARALLDIAIGASGIEQIIIPNLYWSFPRASASGYDVYFPISIPAGSRLSARVRSNMSSLIIQITLRLQGAGGLSSPSRSIVQTIGAVEGTTQGTTITAPSAINTLPSGWTFVGTSSYAIEEAILDFQSIATLFASARALVDISVGASGSEQIILQQISVVAAVDTGNTFGTNFIGPLPLAIPASTQINARYQTNLLTFPPLDLVIYGVS